MKEQRLRMTEPQSGSARLCADTTCRLRTLNATGRARVKPAQTPLALVIASTSCLGGVVT